MRYPHLLAVASAVTLFAAGCNPPAPTGQEAAPLAPTAGAVITDTPSTMAREAPEAPEAPVATEEPLVLRFVSPNIGPPAGGNEVKIDGQGISKYPRIFFGDVQAWIVSVTPTEIRVSVPPQVEPVAAGGTLTVDVTVRNPPVGSSALASETLPQAYSYIDTSAPPVTEEVAEPLPKAPEPTPPVVKATAAAESAKTESPSPAAAAPTSNLVASFSFETLSDSAECPEPNTSIRFTDRSTGGATEWWWDFGDGSTSEQRHQEHCYTVPGLRSVTLTVSNAEGSATTSKIVIAGME